MNLLMKIRKAVMHTKPMMVPTMPRKLVIAKFSKNNDLRRLYPAEKNDGGQYDSEKYFVQKLDLSFKSLR